MSIFKLQYLISVNISYLLKLINIFFFFFILKKILLILYFIRIHHIWGPWASKSTKNFLRELFDRIFF